MAFGLFRKQGELPPRYAVITWREDMKSSYLCVGNKYKRVIMMDYGRPSEEKYSPELISLLQKKKFVLLDLTFGLKRPVEHEKPQDIATIDNFLIQFPRRGFEHR